MAKRPRTETTVARNLLFLVDRHDMEWQQLAQRSGLSLRAINYWRTGEKSPSIENVDALARVFGLTGWHLLSPTLAQDYDNQEWLDRIRSAFNNATKQGQDLMKTAADAANGLSGRAANGD